jgi:glycine/D-amino acid oxidase-like deaminating enzyme
MTKSLERIQTPDQLPTSTTVVIIGAGIVGVSAALTLAERNIPVVVLEKGHIAGEQSSRNLGWVRKTNRAPDDVPMALAADRLWSELPQRVGRDVGYKQNGIMFLAGNEEELATYEAWLESVKSLSLSSKILSPAEIEKLVPGGKAEWPGALYTASDGRAEPAIATAAIAQAAINKGAIIVQNCAVRTLTKAAGKVCGVMTEKGEIRCEQVLLTGGAWSRRFLGNLGISLPTLPLILSVLRTKPMQGPTDIAVGAPNFSFRKHDQGGYVITQRGALDSHIVLDHLLVGHRYLSQLLMWKKHLRISIGRPFLKDLALGRHWSANNISPFEKVRTTDPAVNDSLNEEALTALRKAWPVFEKAEIDETWAGLLEVTPDSNPVIDRIQKIPGLTIATAFSGHGFGTGPAAGQLAADMVTDSAPLIDPAPYRFTRF